MEESLQKVFAVLLSVIIFFVLPVYMTFEKKDDIAYSLALKITTNFVEDVRAKGYMTLEMYDDYISKLAVTGNTYDVMMEHVSKKYYPVIYAYDDDMKLVLKKFDYNLYKDQFENDKKIVIESGTDAGTYENLILSYDLSEEKYTEKQILEMISSVNDGITVDTGLAEYENTNIDDLPAISSIYKVGDSNNKVYTMSTGDEFNIIIKNRNITVATSLFNIITLGANARNSTKVYINYGGTIKNEAYRDKRVDEDTQNYNVADEIEIEPSLSGNYIEKDLVLLLDGEKNIGTSHSNNSDIWKDLSGKNHNATLSGFDFSDTSGWIYNGLKFTGKEYVELGTFDEEEYTIEVVMKLEDLNNDQSTRQSIISNMNDGGCGIIYTQDNDLDVSKKGRIGFEVYKKKEDEVKVSSVYSSNIAEKNKIYSISVSVGPDGLGGIKQIYSENGDIKGITLDGNVHETNSGTKLTIGASPYAGVNPVTEFKGTIYSVRIYNRALTESEIKENFEVDKEKYNI
ncbi:MAG: LamG-like jellyroll fold domain-containing protein [Clostridia bacterium]|nr:LamG-like jellyroll fold domain-containing protein [Clostridia bacterium]